MAQKPSKKKAYVLVPSSKLPSPPPKSSTTSIRSTSPSVADDRYEFTGDARCKACRSAGEPTCAVAIEGYNAYKFWVMTKDCLSKVTPPGTACDRCHTSKLGFCRYPIIDHKLGTAWKKPTRSELAEMKKQDKGKGKTKSKPIQSSQSKPIVSVIISKSSGSGSGVRSGSGPSTASTSQITSDPSTTSSDILSAINKMNETMLQQNAILGRMEAMMGLLLAKVKEKDENENEDEDAEGDDEEMMEEV